MKATSWLKSDDDVKRRVPASPSVAAPPQHLSLMFITWPYSEPRGSGAGLPVLCHRSLHAAADGGGVHGSAAHCLMIIPTCSLFTYFSHFLGHCFSFSPLGVWTLCFADKTPATIHP